MKRSWWILGLGLTFFVGLFVGRITDRGEEGVSQSRIQATKSNSGKASMSSTGGYLEDPLSGRGVVRPFFQSGSRPGRDVFHQATLQALALKDRVRRKEAIFEIMEHVTDLEGVQAVDDAFTEHRSAGKEAEDVWEEYLYLAGKNVGLEAVEFFAEGTIPRRVFGGVDGWSTENPEAALQWFSENRHNLHGVWRGRTLESIAFNAGAKDSQQAIELLSTLSENDQISFNEALCKGISHSEGLYSLMGHYENLVQDMDEVSPLAGRTRGVLKSKIMASTYGNKDGIPNCLAQLRAMHEIEAFEIDEVIAMSSRWGMNHYATDLQLDFLEGASSAFGFSDEDLQSAAHRSVFGLMNEQHRGRIQDWMDRNPEARMTALLNEKLSQE